MAQRTRVAVTSVVALAIGLVAAAVIVFLDGVPSPGTAGEPTPANNPSPEAALPGGGEPPPDDDAEPSPIEPGDGSDADPSPIEPSDADADAEPEPSLEPEPTPPVRTGDDDPEPFDQHATGTVGDQPPAPPPPPSAGSPELRAALAAAIDAADIRADRLSVLVADTTGTAVIEHHADVPRVPASTSKLVTAAAALDVLGADHRFTTQLRATAAPIDGVVDGDLVVVGGNDPTLVSPRFAEILEPDRPQTSIVPLVDAVVDAGIRQVTGSVLADPGPVRTEPLAEGWPDHYLRNLHTGRSSGLTIDLGRALSDENGRLVGVAADDPAVEAARVLEALLDEREVVVAGEAGRLSEDAGLPDLVLAEVDGPPLADLLLRVVDRSDNHIADTVFRAVGAAVGDATWGGAATASLAALAPHEIDWHDSVIADGSGLSRSSRLTATQLVALDIARGNRPDGEAWRSLQAIGGQRGTLRNRLRGSVAEGRVIGKTGSLTDVRSLVGSATGTFGRYHFAVMGDQLEGDEREELRLLSDEVAQLLAEDVEGCERVEVVVDVDVVDIDALAGEVPTEIQLVCP